MKKQQIKPVVWLVLAIVIGIIAYYFLSKKTTTTPTTSTGSTTTPTGSTTPTYSAPTPTNTTPTTPTPLTPTPTFDYYVSSAGDDNNAGTESTKAVRSLASLQAKALAKGAGVTLKFGDKALYRDRLHLPELDNVTIDGGFSTINCAEVVPKNAGAWSQPDAAGLPNVWAINWATDGPVNESFPCVVDNDMPVFVDSVAACNSTPFSYFVDSSDMASGSPITLFINTGSNPNTDAKVYELAKRATGISLRNGATIRNIIAQNQTQNDGAIYVRQNALIEKSLFAFGHKHNLYFSSGTLRDVVAYDSEGHPAAIGPIVQHEPNPAGMGALMERCYVIAPRPKTKLGSAFFGHGNPGTKFDTINNDGAITYNFRSFGVPTVENYNVRNAFGLLESGPGSADATNLLVERSMFKTLPIDARFLSVANNSTYRNMAVYLAQLGNTEVFQLADGVTFRLERSTIVGADKSGMTWNGGGSANINRTIFAFTPRFTAFINLPAAATYVGNYNVFFVNEYGQVKFTKDATGYTTLAAWQAATGQDTNSVFVSLAQQANFFVGNPAAGDFRINPNAQVTRADGTVLTGTFSDGTALVSAGVQEYYNHTSRAVVAGAPIKFPVPPTTYAQCVSYIQNPAGWNFYA